MLFSKETFRKSLKGLSVRWFFFKRKSNRVEPSTWSFLKDIDLNISRHRRRQFWGRQIPGGLSQIIVWKYWCLRRVQEPIQRTMRIQSNRDLTIRKQRRQWIRRWKIDFASNETFSPSYQVAQWIESTLTCVRLELNIGGRVRVQREIVNKFIALSFQFLSPSIKKNWLFHVVVV